MKVRALLVSLLCVGCLKCESVGREEPFAPRDAPQHFPPKIAIVGAGIGGATATHFLRQLFGAEAEVDVYEKAQVGGRLSTAHLEGQRYETGGSSLHPKNKYMADFIKKLGLSKRHVFGIQMGILDLEKHYLVMENNRPINSYGKLFHRYGNSVSNWHTVIDKALANFRRIYEVQNEGHAFTSVENLLRAAHPSTLNLTSISTRRFLQDSNLLPVFVNEIASGVLRISYGQNPEINALAGVTSLSSAKAGLWGVSGGNEKVPQLLIKKAKARVKVSQVTNIRLTEEGKYRMQVEGRKTEEPEVYDAVILTVPLIDGVSNISFRNFPVPIGNFEGHYHRAVVTLVSGKLNPHFLKGNYKENFVQEVLTTKDGDLFNYLGRAYPVDVDEEWNATSSVWKIVSERPLTDTELDNIFSERRMTVHKSWLAYPHYAPLRSPDALGPFMLHPGLFYTSSLEWAASSMEMSAISGKNAALLAYYAHTKNTTLVH